MMVAAVVDVAVDVVDVIVLVYIVTMDHCYA